MLNTSDLPANKGSELDTVSRSGQGRMRGVTSSFAGICGCLGGVACVGSTVGVIIGLAASTDMMGDFNPPDDCWANGTPRDNTDFCTNSGGIKAGLFNLTTKACQDYVKNNKGCIDWNGMYLPMLIFATATFVFCLACCCLARVMIPKSRDPMSAGLLENAQESKTNGGTLQAF